MNALVALLWDSHVHHEAARRWFAGTEGEWATCPITELGFVRLSANAAIVAAPITPAQAIDAVVAARRAGRRRFLAAGLSVTDSDLPVMRGHRQVADAYLIALARHHGGRLVAFDRGAKALGGADVELLSF